MVTRRKFSREFKLEAVKLVTERGVTVAQVRQSFVLSDRTYGARRVWRDVLELGQNCGLHRIERLMREQALRARSRRRGLPKDRGQRRWRASSAQ